MTFSSGGMADNFTLTELSSPATDGLNTRTGKTETTLSLASKNGVFVSFGQSNSCNVSPSIFSPVNPGKIFNLNIYNGGLYLAADPLLGCSSPASVGIPNFGFGNWNLKLADAFITAGKFTNVVCVPAGIGSSGVGSWQYDQYGRIATTFGRLTAARLAPTAVLWQQGESDLTTPQAVYAGALANVIARIRAWTSAPIFIAQSSYSAGTTNPGVVAAQAASVDHAKGIWAGPLLDGLGASYRNADNIHFNDAGSVQVAALFKSAMQAYGAPFA